jgi:hypothetical protein
LSISNAECQRIDEGHLPEQRCLADAGLTEQRDVLPANWIPEAKRGFYLSRL